MFEVLKLLISLTHFNNLVGQNNCDICNLMKPLIVDSGFVSIFILLLFPGTVLGYDITGKWYGRKNDNIGIGFAYLNGKYNFDYTQVAEAYWRVVFNDYFSVTTDLQYMNDKYQTANLEDVDGIIGGIRFTFKF